MATYSKAGRPQKCDSGDVKAILSRINEEKQKASALAADNINRYYKILHEMAIGKNVKAGIKDQVGAIKEMVRMAEEFEKSQKDGVVADDNSDNKQQNAPMGRLISLEAAK